MVDNGMIERAYHSAATSPSLPYASPNPEPLIAEPKIVNNVEAGIEGLDSQAEVAAPAVHQQGQVNLH